MNSSLITGFLLVDHEQLWIAGCFRICSGSFLLTCSPTQGCIQAVLTQADAQYSSQLLHGIILPKLLLCMLLLQLQEMLVIPG